MYLTYNLHVIAFPCLSWCKVVILNPMVIIHLLFFLTLMCLFPSSLLPPSVPGYGWMGGWMDRQEEREREREGEGEKGREKGRENEKERRK